MFHHISYAFYTPVQSKHQISDVITVASAYPAELPLIFHVNAPTESSLTESGTV